VTQRPPLEHDHQIRWFDEGLVEVQQDVDGAAGSVVSLEVEMN
jgi:hypothetical protein